MAQAYPANEMPPEASNVLLLVQSIGTPAQAPSLLRDFDTILGLDARGPASSCRASDIALSFSLQQVGHNRHDRFGQSRLGQDSAVRPFGERRISVELA